MIGEEKTGRVSAQGTIKTLCVCGWGATKERRGMTVRRKK